MTRRFRILVSVFVLTTVTAQAGSEPSAPSVNDSIVYGIVCRVTLAALPAGLRRPLQDRQEILCYVAANADPAEADHTANGDVAHAIAEPVDALAQAFEAKQPSHAIEAAAAIIRLATLAAMPPPDADAAPTTHAHRLDPSWSEAMASHRVRLQDEARVSAVRFEPVVQIKKTIDVVQRRGREASRQAFGPTTTHDETDQPHEKKSQDDELEITPNKLRERHIGILENRIEDAALLGARLIGTAWLRAGMPAFTSVKTANLAKPEHLKPTNATTTPTATSGRYVSSRRSKVFHKSSCSHAKRIKSTNRVIFSSPSKAKAANKKPCRACKPD